MAMTRESLILPTVKCSSCGLQVEISLMGDHICSETTIECAETVRSSFTSASLVMSPVSPPPETFEPFRPYDASIPPEKLGRIPPAVDTKAANEPWMRQGQLTPTSLIGESRTLSLPQADDFFTSSPSLEDDLIPSSRPIDFGSFSERRYGPNMENLSVSPVNTTLMNRMDKIAPGPFDTMRSPSTPTYPPRSASFEDRSMDFLSAPQDPMAPKRSATAPLHINTPSFNSIGAVLPSPSMPKRMDYGGFGPPPLADDELEPKPLGSISRSETLPIPSHPYTELPPPRTPSAPGSRPNGQNYRPSMGPDTTRRPPPRTSLLRPQKKTGSVDLAAEFGIKNPYHTPSDSTSSGYSTFSHPSRTSSQTSPARSQARPEPSDALNMGGLMNEVQNTMNAMRPKDLRIDPTLQPPEHSQLPMLQPPFGESFQKSPGRVDPAVQNGLGFNTPLTPGILSAYSDDRPSHDPAVQPGRTNETFSSEPHNTRKPSGTYRGDCKACRQEIKGKSISSADGRLTGKYHKACFVCTTCSEPFTSAEFYVLDDKPYCEHHYHKLNGSLCGSCRKGVEGQYVEDEFHVKYHVGCFCCLDCGQSLSNGYFEVDGRSFCERDAWRRVQQPWFGNGDHLSEVDLFPRPPGHPGPDLPAPLGLPGPDLPNLPGPSGPLQTPLTPQGPLGPPAFPGNGRRPSYDTGLPGRPGPGPGSGPGPRPPVAPGMGPPPPSPGMAPLRSPFGSPRRPGPALGRGPGAISAQRPRMNKRHTRLGMMA